MNSTMSSDSGLNGIYIGGMYLVSSLLVLVGNGIVINVVIRSESLHLPTLRNIQFMAFSDFCYGLYFIIFAVPSAFSNEFAYSQALVTPSACIHTFLIGQGAFNVLIATVDRYVALCWPLRYHGLMTTKTFLIVNSTTVTLNIIRMCLIVSTDEAFYNIVSTVTMFRVKSKVNAISGALVLVTFIVIVGVLIRLALEMKRSRNRVQPIETDTGYRGFTLAMFLSGVVFCVGYVPVLILIGWSHLSGMEVVPDLLQQISILSLESNSLWNVIIYGAMYKPFRDEFLRLFCNKFYKRRQQMQVQSVSYQLRPIEITSVEQLD